MEPPGGRSLGLGGLVWGACSGMCGVMSAIEKSRAGPWGLWERGLTPSSWKWVRPAETVFRKGHG